MQQKVAILESAFAKDICSSQFIPYIQLHEFEALLYADLSKLAEYYLDSREAIANLEEALEMFFEKKSSSTPASVGPYLARSFRSSECIFSNRRGSGVSGSVVTTPWPTWMNREPSNLTTPHPVEARPGSIPITVLIHS